MHINLTKSYCRTYNIVFVFAVVSQFSCQQKFTPGQAELKGNTYYVSEAGDDKNKGTKGNPWKTIQQLNSVKLKAGDTVFFTGGQTFTGNIVVDSNESGTKESLVVITSYGNRNAVINGGNLTALTVNNASFIKINSLDFIGSGRKDGNTKDGVAIINSHDVDVDSLDISGFQKAGLLVYASKNIQVRNVYAHENGFAGISVSGLQAKTDCQNIHISNCTAENNPGDPTNFGNHSGNGIIAGLCKNVVIENSTATNNGWDMPRVGNGPVGIWCYEADSVTIQYCISYKNKTSVGGGDGGGFDLDGGVTNSVIQSCLSYQNQGSGFGIFQYAGASDWHDNIIRNSISENDGTVSAAGASAFIWNSSHDEKQFKNLQFYNNILYNSKGAAISYAALENQNAGFTFYNNIFVSKDELITGNDISGKGVFLHNDWWSLTSGFNIDGIKDFKAWALQKGQEQQNGNVVGYNEDPRFANPGNTTLVLPEGLKAFANYQIPAGSKLKENLPAF